MVEYIRRVTTRQRKGDGAVFAQGEHIVYGVNGVCRVEEVCSSPFDKSDPRTYYLLVPLHHPAGSTIYTPVDNRHVPMRRLMTPEEIDRLIAAIPRIGVLTVPAEKKRREVYRAVIEELRPEGYVSVIKTVRARHAELTAAHKHFPVSDMEYGRLAKHLLYSECAQVLGMDEQGVEAYIAQRLGKAE